MQGNIKFQPMVSPAKKLWDGDQMPGTGDWQELPGSLYNTVNDSLKYSHKIPFYCSIWNKKKQP
jgi:hypothetical protein